MENLSNFLVLFSKTIKLIIIALFLLFSALSAKADYFLNVVINEIAWMGTKTSYNDEWIVTIKQPLLYLQQHNYLQTTGINSYPFFFC